MRPVTLENEHSGMRQRLRSDLKVRWGKWLKSDEGEMSL